MSATPSYKVNVKTKSLNREYTYTAFLQPAEKSDMPSNWDFDWQGFWQKADAVIVRRLSNYLFTEVYWG